MRNAWLWISDHNNIIVFVGAYEVILCDLFFLYQIFFLILSRDSSLSNKSHSTLLPHYPSSPLRPNTHLAAWWWCFLRQWRMTGRGPPWEVWYTPPCERQCCQGCTRCSPLQAQAMRQVKGKSIIGSKDITTLERWRVDKDGEWWWQRRVYGREGDASSCLGQSFEKAPSKSMQVLGVNNKYIDRKKRKPYC